MPSVQIIVPKYDSKSGRPKMILMGSNGDMFLVPWAPRSVQHSNLGEEVVEVERAGRYPELMVKNPQLHKMSFGITLGKNIGVSIEPDLKRLEAIVKAGGWIQILYGQRETGLWKCVGFSYESVEREPIQNQISRATVSLDFTEVPDARVTVAKASNDFNFRDDAVTASISQSLVELAKTTRAISTGSNTNTGTSTSGPANSGTGGNTGAGGSTTTTPPHIVQSGETLLSIAQKYYGQYGEQFWRLIGDYNKVIGSLNIGQILRIP